MISIEKANDMNEDNNNDTMHEHAKENKEKISENKKKKSNNNERRTKNTTEMWNMWQDNVMEWKNRHNECAMRENSSNEHRGNQEIVKEEEVERIENKERS